MTSTSPQPQALQRMDTTPALVACDIDGTLVRTGHPVNQPVRAAASRVRAAGHHLVLATGRSLVGALPVAVQLGLDDTWLVTSNGAITAHLVEGYYEITKQHLVDAETAIRIALAEAPVVRIAAEIVGDGYRVSTPFPDHELNGRQRPAGDLREFWTNPTPRLALRGHAAYQLVPSLRAAGLTAIATTLDWVDVTAPGISKATALEEIRTHLGVEDHNTVAIGDSENDVEMLDWAACGIAMAHAPAFVIAAADRTTGTIDDDGAASALLSLLA